VLGTVACTCADSSAKTWASNATEVGQVHLSLSALGNVVVTWSASLSQASGSEKEAAAPPCVRHAPAGMDLGAGNMTPAVNVSRWRGRLWSTVELEGLTEGASYKYQCSAAHSSVERHHKLEFTPREFGDELEMRVPASRTLGPPLGDAAVDGVTRLAVLGDLAEGGSGASIIEHIARGPTVDAVLHLGDIAGNLTDEEYHRGDQFLSMIEPIASVVPYMTLPGDRDDVATYNRFFRMPSAGEDPWYSFIVGPARVVMLWTEALGDAVFAGSTSQAARAQRQLAWLGQALQHFDSPEERRRRPWLVVAGHRPIYCSMMQPTCGPQALRLRTVLEPLLLRHHVDLYLSAHLHAYERTFPVHNGSVCPGAGPDEPAGLGVVELPCAPVHIVNGDAGVPPLHYETMPARWTAQRHQGVPGHGELIVYNGTHLQYRHVEVSGTVSDEFWLLKPQDLAHDPAVEEENFLEALFWLAFATGGLTSTIAFIRWSHNDGLKRHHEALSTLRVELSVLSGVPPKVLGAPREIERLVQHDPEEDGTAALH